MATMRAIRVTASLSFALAGLISAPVAIAGQYHVYACHTPSREAAPADGWSASGAGAYDPRFRSDLWVFILKTL
jgi:hypothetical protein